MVSASLYLPLVSWHQYSNPTTTVLASSATHIYAGQKDGHIWVYTVDNTTTCLKHTYLLTGHKAPITALCVLTTDTEVTLFSADETGEIARWDTADGRCQAVNPNGFFGTPTQLKVFDQSLKHYLFCCGQSNEICILNASTLEVVRVWGGHANWVTLTSFYDTGENKQRLMTATMDGRLDIWDMDMTNLVVYKEKKAKLKHALQQTLTDGVLDLINEGDLFLIITRRHAIMFTLQKGNEFMPQFTLPTGKENEEEWAGGYWLDMHRFLLVSSEGNVYDYQLMAPKGIPSGTVVSQDSQLYYSAKLTMTHTFKAEGDATLVTMISSHNSDRAIVTFCNRCNDGPSFSIDKLLSSSAEHKDNTMMNTLSRSKETYLKDLWPVSPSQQPSSPCGYITTTVPVSSNHLAIGYENGTICVVPLSIALLYLNQLSDHLYNRSDTRIFERAHHGKVTGLIVPEHGASSEQKYLLSGGKDGHVKIWNLINGKYVASFAAHASPVASFIEPAEQKDSRIRGCVVSVGHDHSLALISVDSMACLYIIPGYIYPLVQIQWRPSEDYVLFGYSDDTVHVWQLQAGHLDRVLHGKTSKQVMSDQRWPCNHIATWSSQKSNTNINHTVHTKSYLFKSQDLYTETLFAQAFVFNVRRLVYDLHTSLPPNAYTSSSSSSPDALDPTLTTSLSSTILPSSSFSSSTAFSQEMADPLDTKHDDDLDTLKRPPASVAKASASPNGNSDDSKKEEHRVKKRELVSVVMSILLSETSHVSYGIRGVHGHLTLVAPTQKPWTLSSTLTATRLLSIAFLSPSMDRSDGNDIWFTEYVQALGGKIGDDYCPPSLPLLSKYWQDAKARSIFSMAIMDLDSSQLDALVNHWKAYLPASSSLEDTDTQMMTRATIVLGIIGCDQPHMLDDSVRKCTALSLTLLLSDTNIDEMAETDDDTNSTPLGSSQQHQQQHQHDNNMTVETLTRVLSSMELLSQGFSTWETYINASNVLRTLIAYANPTTPSSLPTLASQLAIRQGAKQAIFTIAQNNHMALVIGTLTYDTSHAKKMEHRQSCLKMISSFIRKHPTLLYDYIYRVIEAVVKTLDPNVPHMRESVLSSATSILHDLVKIYPSVDFSSREQKLVVGTLEGATVVYDLQTATRSVVFEGHMGPVAVVKFSPDAKLVATGSLADRTVRVWYSQLSLFGLFTNSLRSQGSSTNASASAAAGGGRSSSSRPGGHTNAQKPYKTFSFALPENLIVMPDKDIQFEWSSNRCVKLRAKDLVMSFNV